jgi:molybdenum cofactor guanylyltransferase
MTGLVLAGGASTRMGADKALLTVAGETLVARVVRRLRPVCGEVLVASGGRPLPGLGDAEVADAVTDAGPMAGIVAGLEAAGTDLVAVVAVDLPLASADVLDALASSWDGEPAVVPLVDGRLQPLHAVYSRDAAPALRQRLEAGLRSPTDAVAALGARVVGTDGWSHLDPGGSFARNINRPEDLVALERSLAGDRGFG